MLTLLKKSNFLTGASNRVDPRSLKGSAERALRAARSAPLGALPAERLEEARISAQGGLTLRGPGPPLLRAYAWCELGPHRHELSEQQTF